MSWLTRSLLGLAAASAAATAVRAQDFPTVISPLRVESDHNGVNLITGKTVMDTPVLSVPGAPNLRFDRIQNAAPYVSGRIQQTGPGEYPQRTYSVHTGTGTSEAFRCVDFDCTSVTGTGSTFQWNINRYRQAGSAAHYTYNLQHVVTSTAVLYYASGVSYPNGETISYTYNTATLTGDPFPGRLFYRPIKITSNLGYEISITYQGSDFNGNTTAWSTPSVVTLYAIGAPTVPLGQLTYSGNTITQLGDATNPSRVYTCTGCNNQLGADIEAAAGSNQLPGEASPARQAAAVAGTQVVGSVTRDGVAWTYAYGNLRYENASQSWLYDDLTVTGPNGFHNFYDIAAVATSTTTHRLVMTGMTDSIGRSTAVGFDEAYRPVQTVSPEGNQVDVVYDEYGNVIRRQARAKPGSVQPNGQPWPDIVETAYFPTDTCFSAGTPIMCYRALWSRDGLNRQTDYAYNALGQLTERTDPADANGVRRRSTTEYATSPGGISRRSVVRVCGVGTTCGTNQEIRTEYQYGAIHALLPTVERSLNLATGAYLDTTYGYDSSGRLTSTDGALGGNADATYNRYDVHGRKIWEIGALGANGVRTARRHTYRNSDDKPTVTETGTVTDPANPVLTPIARTDISYDSRRYAIREALSSGGTTHAVTDKSHDDQGRPVCAATRMNPAAFGQTPGACAHTTAGGNGPDRITRNIYDAAGQLLQIQRAYGTTLQQNYATHTYSLNGKPTSVTDANGNKASMTWDGFDRQARWNFPSPMTPGTVSATDYEAYAYNAAGNRTSLRKRDGTTLTYAYDNLNRVTLKTVPASAGGAAGYAVHYGYDLRNAQLYARFGSATGPGIINTYDGFGRLATTTSSMDGTDRIVTYTSDPHGNHTAVNSNFGYYTGYTFDAADRGLTVLDGGGTVLRMTYDSAGRPSRLDSGAVVSSTASGTYDALGRLATLSHDLANTSADQSFGYGYNAASQITTRTSSNDAYASNTAYAVSRNYTANGLNQYTAAGSATFAYDANGNLTSDGSRTFTYDAENRLVAASGGVALAYDPLGRLWQIASASGTTRFIYDGDALIWETDGAGNPLRAYAHGPNAGADDPLIWYDGAAGFARRFLHADHQGSIIAAADDAGTMVAINAYDSWGIPNAANQGRFQYTGQAWLAELGMYHYKARIYSPTLGRFLQTDPIGYDDQINLYAYVGNDPVNQVDPDGAQGCEVRTGSLICERTTTRSITEVSGDREVTHTITYFSRDGLITNVRRTSEGVRDSIVDPAAAVGAIAGAIRGLGARLLGRAVASGATGRALILYGSTGLTAAESAGLRSLMGQGEAGARVFLQRTLSGQIAQLPEGITRDTVMRYIISVVSTGPRTSGKPVHQMRVQGLLKILERLD